MSTWRANAIEFFPELKRVVEESEKPSDLYGLWQHSSGTAVYVEISTTGEAFQCRIALNHSVIKANGNLEGNTSIIWEPLTIEDASGNPVDSQGFDWGVDDIDLNNSELTLKGIYGDFTYTRSVTEMPRKCR
ncbi:hypothetical protein BTA51_14080 [Hahella sp. CCB-MM4]|uniref:hypothetical protein n=1 Tax=Hahella sp. (strain CCB-MM4) TaxID=1926491 RepID=UPI000B9B8C59|nr:hypothetical protein [Hahella sp. CCB-MM4]OZG72654.1 hypothetical protein BTA51_14080 [Hahella sp. CCB-MM4]